MKQLTIKIEEDQYKVLKEMSDYAKIPLGWFVRKGIDIIINEYLTERRIRNEHDKHKQEQRCSDFQEDSIFDKKM